MVRRDGSKENDSSYDFSLQKKEYEKKNHRRLVKMEDVLRVIYMSG